MIAKGTFKVAMKAEPPFDEVDGVTMGRATFDKTFEGGLVATSQVHMIGVRTKVATSAAYVAVERITGGLEGKSGTFVVTHMAKMGGGQQSLTIAVAPDSGTGELAGIRGEMTIRIEAGVHFYELTYELGG